MKKWFKNNAIYLAGAVSGAITGYLYWRFVGCSSGKCMITSRPFNSAIYGALMGSLLFGLFKKEENKKVVNEKTNSDDI